MTKYFLIIVLSFFSGDIYAKNIYKCKKENGTLSYQKDPCVEDKRTIKEKIEQRRNGGSHNNPSEAELREYFEKNIDAFSIDLKTYNISVLKSKNWRVFKKVLGDDMLHLKYVAEDLGSEISLLMDYTLVQNNKIFNQAELNILLKQMGQKFLESSVQDAVYSEKMDINDGIGAIAIFTDKNLVNKSSYPPGEYLHTLKGLIYKNNFFIHFTLLTNDIESMNNIIALQSLSFGISIDKINANSQSSKKSEPVDEAFAAYLQGNKRESVAMFKNVTKLEPNNFDAWMGYCIALRDTNRLQSAFIACDKAMSLDPNNIEVYVSLINLYALSRVWEEGLEFIESVIKKAENPALIDSINNFGYFAMIDNDIKTADRAFHIAESLGDVSNKLKVDMSIIKYRKGDVAGAKLDIKNVLKSDPENKFAFAIDYKMSKNEELVFPYANQQPYMNIPDRLKRLGKEKNINQKPDSWVQKVFPVRGVGFIKVDVPENWYERIQITKTDESNDEISITLLDFETLTTIVIDIGKVGNDWGLEQINNQLTASLSIYFDKKNINLNPMADKKKGYFFPETKTNDDKYPLLVSAQQELKGNLSIKSLIMKKPMVNKINDKTQRIINSIVIDNLDKTPLQNIKPSVVKKSKSSANETELPSAPIGFSWVRMPEIMAAFLKPDEWFETDRKTKDTHTFALSKESVKTNGSFDTGLTIIAIDNVMDKYSYPPYTVALQMFEAIKASTSNTIITAKDI